MVVIKDDGRRTAALVTGIGSNLVSKQVTRTDQWPVQIGLIDSSNLVPRVGSGAL